MPGNPRKTISGSRLRDIRRPGAAIRSNEGPWPMARPLLLSGVALVLAAGCLGSPARPYGEVTLRYPPQTAAVVTRAPSVAVFITNDTRGEDHPNLVGQVAFRRGRRWDTYPILADEPVVTIVTRALVSALRARGLAVEDKANTWYFHGVSTAESGRAVVGEVRKFDASPSYRGSWSVSYLAECILVLRVYETASGRALLEKTFSRVRSVDLQDGGAVTAAVPPAFPAALKGALAETIEEAVNDPELLGMMRREPA